MIKKQYLVIGAWVVGGVLATIVITSILKGSNKPDSALYKEFKEHLQGEINVLRDQVKTEVQFRNEMKESYEQYMRNDSVLMVLLQQNQVKYVPINKGYAEIPNRIRTISGDNEAIRRAFANY